MQVREKKEKIEKREEEWRKKHTATSCCQYWIRTLWQSDIFCYNSDRSKRTKDITLLTKNCIIHTRTRTLTHARKPKHQAVDHSAHKRKKWAKTELWRGWPASPLWCGNFSDIRAKQVVQTKPCRQFVRPRVWRKQANKTDIAAADVGCYIIIQFVVCKHYEIPTLSVKHQMLY